MNQQVTRGFKSFKIEINSFNKISISTFFLEDLEKLCLTNNIKFLLRKLSFLKRKYLESLRTLRHDLSTLYSVSNLNKKLLVLKLLDTGVRLKKLFRVFKVYSHLGLRSIILKRFPRKKTKMTTIKSPHVFKKSQDHFEIRHHKLVIKLPLILSSRDFISSLLEQTSKLQPMYRVNIKEKRMFNQKKSQNQIELEL